MFSTVKSWLPVLLMCGLLILKQLCKISATTFDGAVGYAILIFKRFTANVYFSGSRRAPHRT